MVFDGKKFAQEIEAELRQKIRRLPKKLKLAIWLEESNQAGKKYVAKKMDMAERLGVEVVLNKVTGDEDGVVVQLPHTNSKFLIDLIDRKKDVDGLKEDSPYQPAVVRAISAILKEAKEFTDIGSRFTVVGASGFVGRNVVRELSTVNGELTEIDVDNFDLKKLKTADVVISCTGQAGLITPDTVKEGVVAIDVGYPRGDFATEVAQKAAFFTPVPSGVGPVTVVMLFQNLLDAVS